MTLVPSPSASPLFLDGPRCGRAPGIRARLGAPVAGRTALGKTSRSPPHPPPRPQPLARPRPAPAPSALIGAADCLSPPSGGGGAAGLRSLQRAACSGCDRGFPPTRAPSPASAPATSATASARDPGARGK